jgi:hypothetical protein
MVWTRDAELPLYSCCRQDKKIIGETNQKFLDMLNALNRQPKIWRKLKERSMKL